MGRNVATSLKNGSAISSISLNPTYNHLSHAAHQSLRVISLLVFFYNLNKVVCQSPVLDGSSQEGCVKRGSQVMGEAEKQLTGFKSVRTKRLCKKKKSVHIPVETCVFD